MNKDENKDKHKLVYAQNNKHTHTIEQAEKFINKNVKKL